MATYHTASLFFYSCLFLPSYSCSAVNCNVIVEMVFLMFLFSYVGWGWKGGLIRTDTPMVSCLEGMACALCIPWEDVGWESLGLGTEWGMMDLLGVGEQANN